MRVVLITALLFLAACTATKTAETPAQRLFALQGEFNIALRTATAYTSKPACSATVPVGCHEPEVKARIVSAAERADNALKTAKSALDTAAAEGRVAAAGQAIRALVSYMVAKGVSK